MKIVSNKTWNTALDLINDKNEKIRKLKSEIQDKDVLLRCRADKISELNAEISRLRRKLNENGITWSVSGIDFPNSTKGGFEGSNIFEL